VGKDAPRFPNDLLQQGLLVADARSRDRQIGDERLAEDSDRNPAFLWEKDE